MFLFQEWLTEKEMKGGKIQREAMACCLITGHFAMKKLKENIKGAVASLKEKIKRAQPADDFGNVTYVSFHL